MKQNLKPFDLQAALAGKPVVTRDGRPVKIAGYNEEAVSSIAGWIEGYIRGWTKDGEMIRGHEGPDDLFMAPEKREVWVCLWRLSGVIGTSIGFSEKQAIDSAKSDKAEIITTVKIWEEEI